MASSRLYCMVPFYWDTELNAEKTRRFQYETIMMTW